MRSFSSLGDKDFAKRLSGLGIYRCRSWLALEVVLGERHALFLVPVKDVRFVGKRPRLAGKIMQGAWQPSARLLG